MRVPIFQVDAFAARRFGGNPAAVLDTAETVRRLVPNLTAIRNLDGVDGVIVTAPGDENYDCVSRYFAPAKGIDEDPRSAPLKTMSPRPSRPTAS
jgi:predicted PhzF superfamily epimerase YddE/YHI9